MRLHRAGRWALWLLILAALCVVAAWRTAPSGALETDILTLLPAERADPVLRAANERSRAAFSQQLLVLVRGPDAAPMRAGARAAQRALEAAGLAVASADTDLRRALELYRSHGRALLTPAQVERFRRHGAQALATDVAAALGSPAGLLGLADDPGGYVARFITRLPRPYPDFMPDDGLDSAVHGEERLVLLTMELPDGAFGADGAERAVAAVAAARRALEAACSACSLEATGAALFTAAARAGARVESLLLSAASTLLIMVLIALAYRSLAPHLLGFLQLGASVLAAAAAVIAVFGSIHILTLVFGTTLLGIAIDYAFLYFSEYWFGRTPPDGVLRKVRSGLGIGLLTGVLAFAFLGMTGFPALAQMAVFSAVGLIEAALVVALIFPATLTRPPRVAEHALVRWPRRFLARARLPSRWRLLLPLLALVLAAPGWARLEARDSVRELSHFPPALMQADAALRGALGRQSAPGYFLIEADSLEAALAREDALAARLHASLPRADLLGLSRYLPPAARQRASLAAWQELLAAPEALGAALQRLGLPAELAAHLDRGAAHAMLRPDALLGAVPALRRFILPAGERTVLMATLFSADELPAAPLEAAAADTPGARFINPVARVDAVFTDIRVRAFWLVLIGYVLISVVLIVRYRLGEALRMLYPPLLALALTLGILGWIGAPLNIFSVVALILILGLGRDYAVFLREVGAREAPVAMAVLLSAATTVIAFGLLAFSRIPALHAFGLATGLGIALSALLTPLSLPPARAGGDT